MDALGGATELELESLVGHPLFLDAFCQMIEEIPESKRAAEADTFQLRSPNIFGEIVDRVLQREHVDKFLPAWENLGIGKQLTGNWKDPFSPTLQRELLRELVLAAARDGGAQALRLSENDVRYRRLRHGLFAFSDGAGGDHTSSEAAALKIRAKKRTRLHLEVVLILFFGIERLFNRRLRRLKTI